jgi:hypothetical protein
MVALGAGATVMAVPRALSGIVAVPQDVESGISRSVAATPSSKPSTAKMPVWSAATAKSPTATDTKPASASDTKPPTAVTGLHVLANTESSVTIGWDASKDNVAVKLYLVKRDGFATAQTFDTKLALAWPHRTASVLVQVAAVDTSGNQGEWRSLVVPPPATVSATTAAAVSVPVVTVPAADPTVEQSTSAPPVATTAPASTAASLVASVAPSAASQQTSASVPTSTVLGTAAASHSA